MCIPASWDKEHKISPSSIALIPYKNSDHFTHSAVPNFTHPGLTRTIYHNYKTNYCDSLGGESTKGKAEDCNIWLTGIFLTSSQWEIIDQHFEKLYFGHCLCLWYCSSTSDTWRRGGLNNSCSNFQYLADFLRVSSAAMSCWRHRDVALSQDVSSLKSQELISFQ